MLQRVVIWRYIYKLPFLLVFGLQLLVNFRYVNPPGRGASAPPGKDFPVWPVLRSFVLKLSVDLVSREVLRDKLPGRVIGRACAVRRPGDLYSAA